MVSLLQFIKACNAAFEPETSRLMAEAFDAACLKLGNIGGPAHIAIADRIINAATAGERDPVRLRDAGMAAPGQQVR